MVKWKQTYWVVFFSNLITAVGMMSFLPFFPAILEDLGVTDLDERMAWTGLVFGGAPLAAAIMGPIWGAIGDRFGRKLMLIRALLAISVFVGLMGFARTPLELFLLRLCQGVFSGFIPPSIALVSVLAPRERQGRVTASLQAALPLGMILGPLVGGLIQDVSGTNAIFFFVSGAAGVSAVLVALVAYEDASLRMTLEHFSPTSVLVETARDLKRLARSRDIRWTLAVLFALQFGVGSTNPQLQLYVEEIWHGDPTRIGWLTAWLFTSMAIAGLISTPAWGWVGDRFGHRRGLLFAAVGGALVLGATTGIGVYALLVASRVLIGLTVPGANVCAFGVAAMESADENRGGAFAAIFSARALAVSLGSMCGGALSSLFGIRGLFLAAGTGVLFVVAVLWRRDARRSAAARA